MKIVRKPATRHYYTQGAVEGSFLIVTETFPQNRFLAILWNLHFNNDLVAPRGSPGYDKLYKIRPIIKSLTNTYLSLYNPNRANSVDEAVVSFKGRSSLKQYVPKNPLSEVSKCGVGVTVRLVTLALFRFILGK